jgi:ribonuclease T2
MVRSPLWQDVPRFQETEMRWSLALASMGAALAVHAAPAPFDHYVLALSVAPAFCEDQPERKRGFAQCRALSDAAFRATPLTLHGLWPNRRDGRHPAYCGEERAEGKSFCRLPALPLTREAREGLERVMPASADCLDRYQWAKHGSCSGLGEADYFGVSRAMTERVNRAIGEEVARHAGREVALARLREALEKRDRGLEGAVVFDCRTPRSPEPVKRRPMLREVRVYFERDPVTGMPGRPLPARYAGVRRDQSGCPRDRAYVDTPLD